MHILSPSSRHHRAVSLISACLCATVLLSGCRDAGPAGGPPPPPEVATVTVAAQRVVLEVDLPGRTVPCRVADIRPQVNGIVDKRLFAEGAEVKAGDLLYRIDPRTYEAAYANAVAAVAGAKAAYASALASRSRAEAALENARAGLAVAEAGHATAVATRDAAKTKLVATRAAHASAEANAVPLRLRADRFRELAASRAISQQDLDDVTAALSQSEAAIDSAAAAVQGAEADLVRTEAAIQVAQAEIKRAKAGIMAAEADIENAAAAVQSAQAGIGSAEAARDAARINLDYTQISAPIDGTIGRSQVTEGALVTAHQPLALATVQQLDPMFVDVPQATADLLQLQRRLEDGRLSRNGEGNTVRLILEDGTPYPHSGTLQFRDVTVDPTTGSFILRLVFPNPERTLLPNMFVRAVIEEGVSHDAILIPQLAVTRDPKGTPMVMLVDAEGLAQQRVLTIDRAVGNQWRVTAGLTPGEQVITEGLQRVRPGTPVQVATPADSPTSDAAATAN